MEQSVNQSSVIGIASAMALAAIAMTGCGPQHADVISAKEVTETIQTPREECADVVVTRRAPTSDPHRIGGTMIGVVAGGMLGSTIGGGRGNTVATIAGAAAGGYAGNRIQKSAQDKNVVQTTEKRCKTVYDTSVKSLGYDVTYRLDGKEAVVRLAHDPGPRIPVKDGRPVMDDLRSK